MNMEYKDKKLEEDLLHIKLYNITNHAIVYYTLQIAPKKAKDNCTLDIIGLNKRIKLHY